MSTDEQQQQHVSEVQGKIDKYEFVLKALVALEHALSAKGAAVHQGKHLHIPGAEPGGGGARTVTPDIVVEAPGRGRPYRAIIEIKGSLPRRPKNWDGVIAQLEKYRLATGGWGAAAASDAPHDVMLAADAPHARRFADEMGKGRAGSGIEGWIVVIRVAAVQADDDYIEVAKVYGRIGHPGIDAGMSPDGDCRIPMYKILKEVNKLKFYDSNPPVEYTMAILWDHVFLRFVHGKKLRKVNDYEKVEISITIDQIRDTIGAFAPRTNPHCVRESWICDAMSAFVEIKIAKQEADGLFTIAYRRRNMPATDWITASTAGIQKDGAGAERPKAPYRQARIDER